MIGVGSNVEYRGKFLAIAPKTGVVEEVLFAALVCGWKNQDKSVFRVIWNDGQRFAVSGLKLREKPHAP